MTLKYKLTFFDYWHLSSGLSAGAKLDSMVVKDDNQIPYAPGKTIKGLVREMVELHENCEFINRYFGGSTDEKDKCFTKESKNTQGKCYFANAILDDTIKNEIVSNNLQDNLYDVIASTKIDNNGIAVDNTLREIEVVIPLELYGEILDIPTQEDFDRLAKALKSIKRMGLNRNRGLGRCQFLDVKQEVK